MTKDNIALQCAKKYRIQDTHIYFPLYPLPVAGSYELAAFSCNHYLSLKGENCWCQRNSNRENFNKNKFGASSVYNIDQRSLILRTLKCVDFNSQNSLAGWSFLTIKSTHLQLSSLRNTDVDCAMDLDMIWNWEIWISWL